MEFAADGSRLGVDALVLDRLEPAALVEDAEVLVILVGARVTTRIEIAEVGKIGDRVAALRTDRRLRRVGRLAIVEALEVEADIAATFTEFLGDVALDLVAADRVERDMVGAVAVLDEAADVIAHGRGQAPAIIEVEADFAIVDARRQADFAALGEPGLADVVDDRTRRLRREGRGRAAANRLDALDIIVEAEPIVVVAELNVAEQHGRQAIFLQLDIFRTAGGHRDAAHADVGVAAGASSAAGLDAGDQAEHFGFRMGREILDQVLAERGHRNRAFEAGLVAAGGRHDDFVAGQVGLGSGDRGGRCCRSRRGGNCGRFLGESGARE